MKRYLEGSTEPATHPESSPTQSATNDIPIRDASECRTEESQTAASMLLRLLIPFRFDCRLADSFLDDRFFRSMEDTACGGWIHTKALR